MRLFLKNFMSHDESVIELPSRGIVQITGPNGSGKSSIIEAISQCLWGKSCRSVRWSPWREQAGHVKIRDGELSVDRDWTGKSKKLAFGDTIFDTMTKAQEALEAIVGPFDVWRRTCVFSSADAAHFTLASDAERKELLEQLLGLGWFDRALALCKTDLRSARASLATATEDIRVSLARAEGLKANLDRLASTVEELPPPQEIGLLRAEVHKLTDHLSDVAREALDTDKKISALRSAGAVQKERAQVARSKLSRLDDAECYACGQAVSDAVRASLQREIDDAITEAREARERVQEELDSLLQAREEQEREANDLRELLNRKRSELQSIEQNTAARKKAWRVIEDAKDEINQLQATVALAQEKREQLVVDVAELEACEELLGTRGIRARVVAGTLSSIESLANTWMKRLGSKIEIGLRPYTEKKSGGVVDSISLVLSGAGGDQGYLGASAGERRRVDVALLLALAELASARATGTSWQSPIFFDEVFDSLDADGREAVVELMEDLAKDRCVVVITHDQTVASAASKASDLRIRIDGGSVCK